jgi:hypothetical protein
MKVGDTVAKLSGKPFQNGMKTAVVEGFGEMVIPKNHTLGGFKTVACVTLMGCEGKVRQDILEVREDGTQAQGHVHAVSST